METVQTWLSDNGFSSEPPTLFTNDKGQHALILAAQQGRVDVLKFLLTQGANLTVLDAYGNNALWAACFAEAQECAALLLAAGINVDYQNPSGATALIYSSSSGKSAMVKQLLQADANPELTTQDDFSALDLAATVECLKLLRTAIKNLKAKP
jgi:uncharacterized protein